MNKSAKRQPKSVASTEPLTGPAKRSPAKLPARKLPGTEKAPAKKTHGPSSVGAKRAPAKKTRSTSADVVVRASDAPKSGQLVTPRRSDAIARPQPLRMRASVPAPQVIVDDGATALTDLLTELGMAAERESDASVLALDLDLELVVSSSFEHAVEYARREPLQQISEFRRVPVMVATRIGPAMRGALEQAGIGWFDRSAGEARILTGGVFIHVGPVGSAQRYQTDTGVRSTLAAAVSLLVWASPQQATTVAALIGVHQTSISRAYAALEDLQLVERTGRGRFVPAHPELFAHAAALWPRPEHLLAAGTLPEHWAEAGADGAVHYGAPLVSTPGLPSWVWAPSLAALRVESRAARRREPVAGGEVLAGVDPTGGLIAATSVGRWAHPVICALDLAQSSRGREALEMWDHPARVW